MNETSAKTETPPAGGEQTLRIIWAAFVGSIIIYAVVVALFTSLASGPGASTSLLDTLRPVFWIAAIAAAGATFFLKRTLARQGLSPPAGAAVAAPAPDRLRTASIVTWALSESIAIFGLVLAFLARDAGELIPFAAVALVLLYVHRPPSWPVGV